MAQRSATVALWAINLLNLQWKYQSLFASQSKQQQQEMEKQFVRHGEDLLRSTKQKARNQGHSDTIKHTYVSSLPSGEKVQG